MTLNPSEEFIVARQLSDPSDNTTYYVRAFIRNAKTDELIKTLDLEGKGGQRFTKVWQVPQDPTGLGFYITVTTVVYTDSGCTTVSPLYAMEQYELLVQDRLNPYLKGGGGADVDYRRIQKMIDEAVAKIVIPEAKDPETFDYETLARGFESVISKVEGKEIPVADLSPVVSRLEALQGQIKAIRMPETDLSPVIERIDTAISVTEGLVEEMGNTTESSIESARKQLSGAIDQVEKGVADVNSRISDAAVLLLDSRKKNPQRDVIKEYLDL